ncbi:hypothetical protein SDC9_110736 [bioreactor metagenome]|uniref:Uncharacterized protein n=1 Tax=bioreactor metagenome TaxID=1076179 RepID=A0A645BEU3_9ZZZZ
MKPPSLPSGKLSYGCPLHRRIEQKSLHHLGSTELVSFCIGNVFSAFPHILYGSHIIIHVAGLLGEHSYADCFSYIHISLVRRSLAGYDIQKG